MERRKDWKDWKDFETFVDERSDFRAWFHCSDPEERELRKQYLGLMSGITAYHSRLKRIPMPDIYSEARFARSGLHIRQTAIVFNFMEILLERFLREESDQNLNLLFAFLEAYSDTLLEELTWCDHPQECSASALSDIKDHITNPEKALSELEDEWRNNSKFYLE